MPKYVILGLAIPVVLFRHLVDQNTTAFLETILLITLISGSITGFMVKIIIPLSKNLYLKDEPRVGSE